jgi:hypothetical protein
MKVVGTPLRNETPQGVMKPITYKIAHASGWDAGNRSMRKAGRSEWNEDDYNESIRVMNRLLEAHDGRVQTKVVHAQAKNRKKR